MKRLHLSYTVPHAPHRTLRCSPPSVAGGWAPRSAPPIGSYGSRGAKEGTETNQDFEDYFFESDPRFIARIESLQVAHPAIDPNLRRLQAGR